ncbi:MAG: DUF6438 domain-containing protein [Acidobacteriota bacterium]
MLLAACERASGGPPAPQPQVAAAPHELVATLARTACYGDCPVYKLAIYRDGVVEYTGERYVELRGPAIGHVTAAQLAALDRMFADARYFELADRYLSHDMTDMSSATTTYQLGARAKRIEHYSGDTSTPQALERLEDGIDRLVDVDHWIGSAEAREQHAREWE